MSARPWVVLVLIGAVLAALSNISLKHGLTQINALLPRIPFTFQRIPYLAGNLYIWLGLIGLGAAFLFWMMGLSRVKLNNAYPVFVGVEYSLVMFLSWLILGETLVFLKIAGAVLIFLGIIMLFIS